MGDFRIDWTRPFTIGEAMLAGFDRAAIRAALRSGRWIRLRQGVFVTRAARAAAAASPETLHAQDVHALMLAMSRRRLAAAESSAARILGLEFEHPPPAELIVVTDDPDVAGTHRDGYFLRSAQLPEADLQRRHGIPITSPARTVFDLAANNGFTAGVVAAESAYRRKLIQRADLEAVLLSGAGRPGVSVAREALLFAAATGSVLESVSRVSMRTAEVTMPTTQYVIWINGRMYIVDFYWNHLGIDVFGEADGLGKYVLGEDRMSTIRALRAEKAREQDLLDTGAEVVRWGWTEARDPALLGARINGAFARARERQRGRAS